MGPHTSEALGKKQGWFYFKSEAPDSDSDLRTHQGDHGLWPLGSSFGDHRDAASQRVWEGEGAGAPIT